MGIQLKTLGHFSVFRDGVEETAILSWRRRLAILTFIGVEGEATRDQLTTLFWPEKGENKARHSLSQALYEVRQACGSDCLVSHGDRVRASSRLEVDAAQFGTLVKENRHREALEHYKGEFLHGVHLVGTPGFEDWVERTRGTLRRLHRKTRDAVIREHMDQGRDEVALPLAREWVELEPLEDEAQYWFINLLIISGRRSEALLQYETFERALAKDDLYPLDDTRNLIDQLRTGGGNDPPIRLEAEEGSNQKPVPEPDGPVEEIGPETPPRLTLQDLVQALKDRWVFRAALTYVAALFVWIQVADALIGIDFITPLMGQRITTLSLAALPGLAGITWALEPWIRDQRQRDGGGRDPLNQLNFHLGGMWRAGAGIVALLASGILGMSTWPDGTIPPPVMAADERPNTLRHGFAILPIQPEDTSDEFLTTVAAHLTRSLIAHFREFDVLNVPSESRVARYASDPPPPDTIIDQLGVDLLLLGIIGRRGDSLLVSLDLERKGLSREHLTNLVSVRGGLDEIELVKLVSAQISEQLRRELQGEFRFRDPGRGASSPRAFQLAQQGEDERLRAIRLIGRQELLGAARALEAADTAFAAAIAEDPEWPEPHFFRGFMATTRVSLAMTAKSVDPESPLAIPQEDLTGILRDGLELIRPGLLIDPTHKDGLYKKAEVLRFLSYYPEHQDSVASIQREIEVALEAAIRGDPPRPDAMLRLAQLRYGQGEFERALELYEDAYERDVFQQRLPNDLLNLGRLRLEAGQGQRGFNECSEAAENSSGWDRLMLHECQLLILGFGAVVEPNLSLAHDLLEDDRVKEAVARRGPGLHQQLLTLYAAVLARAGETDSASAVFRSASTDWRDTPRSEYGVAFLAIMGDTARAIESLRQAPDLPLHSVLFSPLRGYPAFDSIRGARAERGGSQR